MWQTIAGVLLVSGILTHVLFGSMPPILLGITIVSGVALLFYVIRPLWEILVDEHWSLIVVGVLFVSGILYYVFARSMPPIVLGITIVCGAVLLFCVIRTLREIFAYRHMSLEELEEEREEAEEKLDRILRERPLMPRKPKAKVVSTEKVVCRTILDEVYTALLLIHEDGSVTVKCEGDCPDCVYGDVE